MMERYSTTISMKAVLCMKWLILLHVVSAILGIGPTLAFPMLLRAEPSVREMGRALEQVTRLEMFPKVFGTLAVVSGAVLFWLGSYGPFLQAWIAGSLLLFIAVEVLVVGFLNPAAKKLQSSLDASNDAAEEKAPSVISAMYAKVRNLHMWATILSMVIVILMVWKP
jgi:uncharacterized membrane protein SirB2